MSSAILSRAQIDAANRLHAQLDQWQRADRALELLRNRCPDFGPDATLLKVVSVNSLYGTNVYATLRVATHITAILAEANVQNLGPELVERLASVPMGGKEKKPIRRYSFASKFAHFFIDPEQYPILDSYAEKMVRLHLGRSLRSRYKHQPYLAYVQNIERLIEQIGFVPGCRALDRYLWLAGQYRAWLRKPQAKINGECRELFRRGAPDLQLLSPE